MWSRCCRPTLAPLAFRGWYATGVGKLVWYLPDSDPRRCSEGRVLAHRGFRTGPVQQDTLLGNQGPDLASGITPCGLCARSRRATLDAWRPSPRLELRRVTAAGSETESESLGCCSNAGFPPSLLSGLSDYCGPGRGCTPPHSGRRVVLSCLHL